DYGVVINEIDADIDHYEIDAEKTIETREYIRRNGGGWLDGDVVEVRELFEEGEFGRLDVLCQYGVIMDDATNKVLKKSTEQFRESMLNRSATHLNKSYNNTSTTVTTTKAHM